MTVIAYEYVEDYNNFDDAISSISNKTLVINGNESVLSDIEIPSDITLKFPQGGKLNIGKYSIRNAIYKWTISGEGTNEYYLEIAAGGSPGVKASPTIYVNSVLADKGKLGELAAGDWGWGDNDSLGYYTVYIRLSDGADPDTKAVDYIEAGYKVVTEGDVKAGLYKIFEGDGRFLFNIGSGREVYSEWWGARANSSVESSVPIGKAMAALPPHDADTPGGGGVTHLWESGGTISFSKGEYQLDGTIVFDDLEHITFLGASTNFRYTQTGYLLDIGGLSRWCYFKDVRFSCAKGGGNKHNFTALRINRANYIRFNNVDFFGADVSIRLDGTITSEGGTGNDFLIFDRCNIWDAKTYGIYGIGHNAASTFDFASIHGIKNDEQGTAIFLEPSGNNVVGGNLIRVGSLSHLNNGIKIHGDHNHIHILYAENIVSQGGVVYENIGGVNYLVNSHLLNGIKVTGGAIIEENIASNLHGSRYFHPASKSLVGEWSFDEGVGDKVFDNSYLRNAATLWTTPTWSHSGINGFGVQFDPASLEYANIPAKISYATDTSFSFFLLFMVNNSVPNYKGILTKKVGGNNRMMLYYDQYGAVRFQVIKNGAAVFDRNLRVRMAYGGYERGGYIPLTITFTLNGGDNKDLWCAYQGGFMLDTWETDAEYRLGTDASDIRLARGENGNYSPISVSKFAWYIRALNQQEAALIGQDNQYLMRYRERYHSAAPTTGYWNIGERVYDSTPSAGGKLGWVCVTAGTPGTWKAFGAIDV